jgi:hypothetical protein
LFRAYRRSLFDDAAQKERFLELGEGLAEYTGVVLSAPTMAEALDRAGRGLADASQRPTFVRSFAYASGPAYGLLLDGVRSSWRQDLRSDDDLGELLRAAYAIEIPKNLSEEARLRAKRYGLDTLWVAETQREQERQTRLAKHRARLIDGPIVRIPLRRMNIQFNPGNLVPLDDIGTVYPTLRITDVWGILTVTNGALLTKDWTAVFVPAPQRANGLPIQGDGWTLELKEGWRLRPGKRSGDYVLDTVEHD